MIGWLLIVVFLLGLLLAGPLPLIPLYAAISLITLMVFAIDKRRAIQNARRISEKNILGLALFFGWPGALAGRTMFRHKTQKQPFSLWLHIIVTLHFAAIAAHKFFFEL